LRKTFILLLSTFEINFILSLLPFLYRSILEREQDAKKRQEELDRIVFQTIEKRRQVKSQLDFEAKVSLFISFTF